MTYYLVNGTEKAIAHQTTRGIKLLGQLYDTISEIEAMGWVQVDKPY